MSRLRSRRPHPTGSLSAGGYSHCFTYLVALATTLITVVAPAVGQNVAPQPKATEEEEAEKSDDLFSLYYSAHLPTDRQLSQDLKLAERLLKEGRYSEGLPLIDRVLGASEDALELEGARDSKQPTVSLKSEGRRLLAELPPEGFAALELETGVVAQRHLEEAMQKGDLGAIAHIAGRYPLTKAATQAMAIVAQASQDSGDFGTAARRFSELAQCPALEPQVRLSFLLRSAACWGEAGEVAELETTLNRLEKDFATQQISKVVGGDFEQWEQQIRARAAAVSPVSENTAWGIEGGSPSRNPVVASDVPHAWPAWRARTVEEVHLQQQLVARHVATQREGRAWLPMASPIAVGDLVIVRTPHTIVAVDWKTGRRVWETRREGIADPSEVLNLSERYRGRMKGEAFSPVEQRVWVDSIYAALSADGRRAYAVGDLPAASTDNYGNWRGQFFWGMEETTQELEGNSLSAYELESEGKLVWRIHGSVATGDLEGAFFLGPPLAVSGHLYVLAEIRNSIYLLVLEPATGHLEWKQPLVNMEQNVADDTLRRIVGATPAYAHGLILCPTSAGCVVAVDAIDRSIRWVYRFGVDESVASRQTASWNQNRGAYQAKLSDRWSRVRCIAGEGNVVVTSPETNKLHCLEPDTGVERWSLPREERLLVLGIAQGKVVVAGDDWIEARKLSDGTAAWSEARVRLPEGSLLAGLPLVTEQQVFVPLTIGQLAVMELATGKLVSRLEMQQQDGMGNLAFHRGTLLSQSVTSLARYDQLADLQRQADQGSAESPPEPQALRIRGEIAWTAGDLDKAIASFEQAYRAAPDDAMIRTRLADGLLAGLKHDYLRYQDRGDLLTELLADSRQRVELLRLHVDGSLASDRPAAAWRYALELFESDRDEVVLVASDHLVLVDRWFAARMNRLWEQADPELRDTMAVHVEKLAEEAQNNLALLTRLARYFGSIPAGAVPRMELARRLVDRGRLSEAEMILLQAPPDSLHSGVESAGQRGLLQRLDGRDHRHVQRQPAPERSAFATWNDGQVTISKRRVTARPDQSSSHMRRQSLTRIVLAPQSSGGDWEGPLHLALTDGGSQLVGWNEQGIVECRIPLGLQDTGGSSARPHIQAYRFGHLCVVASGRQLASVDLRTNVRNGPGPQLWASQGASENPYSYESAAMLAWQRRQGIFVQTSHARGAAPSHHAGELCTANAWGVVLREGKTLRCFDPLDGELLWQRDGAPAGGETFSNGRHLIMARAGEAKGLLISMIDGSTLGEWQRPPAKWVGTVGGNAITMIKGLRGQQLRVVEVATGKTVFFKTYPSGAAIAYPDPETIVAMDRKGKLEVVDAVQGKVLFTQTLQPEPNLRSLHVVRDAGTLYLGMNTLSSSEHEKAGHVEVAGAPLVTGRLYAMDATTGVPRWGGPATLDGHGLATLQAPASPVLLLVGHRRTTSDSSGSETARLLCLDKRNGRSLVREEGIASLETHSYMVSLDRTAADRVVVDLERTLLELDFTDRPRPPEPVALSEVEVAPVRKESSLWGIFGKLGDSSIEAPPSDVDDD